MNRPNDIRISPQTDHAAQGDSKYKPRNSIAIPPKMKKSLTSKAEPALTARDFVKFLSIDKIFNASLTYKAVKKLIYGPIVNDDDFKI